MGKILFSEMWDTGKTPEEIIQSKNLKQISDESELKALIKEVFHQNPKQLEDYKKGKEKLFGFFVGQIMKKTKGQANPQKLSSLLKQALEEC